MTAVTVDTGPKLTRKGVRTRNRLITAAKQVFEEVGFVHARVVDIAAAAGVSHGSFYTYFKSRDEIFEAVADEVFDDMYTAAPTEVRADNHMAVIAAGHAQYYDFWSRNHKILITIDQVASFEPSVADRWRDLREKWISYYSGVLERLREQQLVDPTLDPYHAACALGAMVEHSMRRWLGHQEQHDRTIALQTLNHIWSGTVDVLEPSTHQQET